MSSDDLNIEDLVLVHFFTIPVRETERKYITTKDAIAKIYFSRHHLKYYTFLSSHLAKPPMIPCGSCTTFDEAMSRVFTAFEGYERNVKEENFL